MSPPKRPTKTTLHTNARQRIAELKQLLEYCESVLRDNPNSLRPRHVGLLMSRSSMCQSALGELAHRLQSEGPLVPPTPEVCAICGHEVCTTDIPHPRTLCEPGSGSET